MEEFNVNGYNEEGISPEEKMNKETEFADYEDISSYETVAEEKQAPSQNDEFEQPAADTVLPPFYCNYNPINYSAVKAMDDYKPMSRGLKFFAILMVMVIVATAACAGGYFWSEYLSRKKDDTIIGLEAKPKDTDEFTAAQVYEKVNPNVVGISVYGGTDKMAYASGVIYTNSGYIVTNDHIYADIPAAKFKIYDYQGKEYDAEYVAGDKISDLAVLKVKGAKFKAATFGNSDQVIFGESVVAIGRPGGASDVSSITKGIVSAVSRRVRTTSNYSTRHIETDCPINPGSSGGALVNMYGQVVGITSSKLASSDIDAVGYAIPSTTVKRIVDELIKERKIITRAKLGIEYNVIDSVIAEIKGYDYKGLLVEDVAKDSDLYGKVKKKYVITHINDIEIISDSIVLDIIEKSRAGDKIKVTFIDENGKSNTLEAILKANVSESSYNYAEPEERLPNNSDKAENGAFNWPDGY